MEYLQLGKIIDKFGLDGTLKVYSTTSNGNMRYKEGAIVLVFDEQNNVRKEFKVLSYRHSGMMDYVLLEGIDSSNVESFKGMTIQVPKDRNDLEVGYYFYSDLVGCEILDSHKNVLGTVKNVEEFPAQLTLRVSRKNAKDFFVPFIKEFILNVDIDNKKITINVLEGML